VKKVFEVRGQGHWDSDCGNIVNVPSV